MNISKTFTFIRYVDKMQDRYFNENMDEHLESGLSALHEAAMQLGEPPSEEIKLRMLRIRKISRKRGWAHPKVAYSMMELDKQIKAARKKLSLRLDNHYLKHLLKLVEPIMSAYNGSRMLGCRISDLVNKETASDIFTLHSRLVNLLLKEMDNPKRARAKKIKTLARKLGYSS